MEGFAHAGSSSKIHLESLHRLLPEGIMTAAGQVVRAIFENVLPGRGYTYKDSPRIKKFLEDSTLHQRAGKRLRVDYRGSSEVRWVCPSENNSKAWFWRGSMRCTDATHVKAIFTSKDVADRQQSTLGSVSLITFACSAPAGPDAGVPGIMDVDLLVHSSTNVRLSTLQAWMHPASIPEMVKNEWEYIRTGQGRPYTTNSTVQTFLRESTLNLQESTLNLPTTGKRLRVDLVGSSGHAPNKRGPKVGSRNQELPSYGGLEIGRTLLEGRGSIGGHSLLGRVPATQTVSRSDHGTVGAPRLQYSALSQQPSESFASPQLNLADMVGIWCSLA